ncbi:unnamed protein product, partial [Ectocarpus sp. 6 AP-2014]
KEGGSSFDLLRPNQPPPATQPWMLPPSPPAVTLAGTPSPAAATLRASVAGAPADAATGGVLSETPAVAAEAAGHQRNSTTPPPRPPSSAAATAPGSAEVAPSPSSAALPSSSVLGASHAGPGGVAKAPSGLVLGGPPEKESQHRPLTSQQQPNAQGTSTTALAPAPATPAEINDV